ncbi:hypothetical protein BHE74_00009067 [Ensete ventricosum]|nr:hypothetical protein BHE74_00009067 [Ensete ventricosum]
MYCRQLNFISYNISSSNQLVSSFCIKPHLMVYHFPMHSLIIDKKLGFIHSLCETGFTNGKLSLYYLL